jgi:hypothetical protein
MSDPRHDDSRAAEVQLLGNIRAREEELRARPSPRRPRLFRAAMRLSCASTA